jgi:hypothetical protein
MPCLSYFRFISYGCYHDGERRLDVNIFICMCIRISYEISSISWLSFPCFSLYNRDWLVKKD